LVLPINQQLCPVRAALTRDTRPERQANNNPEATTMNTWQQLYTPLGGLGLSALVALIPIIFFFLALAVFRMKGHIAGSITLALSLGVAILAYGMPADMAFAAAGYGFAYGLWPIAWIIVAAVFLYKLTVKSGQFEVIRSSVLSITDDQRLQVLLIGFSFGAFLEGAAGFGAPVAITAALLVGLGFNPLYAAGLCLIANTAPVAFGALGIPITVAGQVTGIDPFKIGAMTGRQLPLLSIIVPFWLVAMMDGWKGVKETWPAALVAGGSFAVTQFFTSNFIGPELPDITSALVSLISLTLFLKVWSPRRAEDSEVVGVSGGAATLGGFGGHSGATPSPYSFGQILKAWSPFLILTVLVTIWTLKPFKALFAPGGALEQLVFLFAIPHLDQLVIKVAPIVSNATAIPAIFKLDPISATGTAIFFSALISMLVLKIDLKNWSDHSQGNLHRAEVADPVDRHGAGLRLRHQLLRHVHHPGPGAGRHRRAVPVLLAVPRLAGRVPDRLGHLVQRPVRLAAGHHRAPDRGQRHPAGGRQHQRRRDRQDDLAAIHRRGLRRHRHGRQGIRPVPLHPQAQPDLRHLRRPDHPGPGLLADRYARALRTFGSPARRRYSVRNGLGLLIYRS